MKEFDLLIWTAGWSEQASLTRLYTDVTDIHPGSGHMGGVQLLVSD